MLEMYSAGGYVDVKGIISCHSQSVVGKMLKMFFQNLGTKPLVTLARASFRHQNSSIYPQMRRHTSRTSHAMQ
jgi:uncharacterized protein involved in propanediol utilization